MLCWQRIEVIEDVQHHCFQHADVQRPSQGRLVVVRAAHATMPVLWPCTFANQSQAVWLYFLFLCEFEMAVSRLCCLVGLVAVLGASGSVTLSRPVGFEGQFVQDRVLGSVFFKAAVSPSGAAAQKSNLLERSVFVPGGRPQVKSTNFLATRVLPVDAYKVRNSLFLTVRLFFLGSMRGARFGLIKYLLPAIASFAGGRRCECAGKRRRRPHV